MELFNRELSWLAFNERVLQESADESNPLVERMRFLGIYSNNLDEFFRVRAASVRRLNAVGKKKMEGFEGGPKALLAEIKKIVIRQQKEFESSYQKILSQLKDHKVLFVDHLQLNTEEAGFVREFFREKTRPTIVPIMLSPKNPFPQLRDTGIYLCVKISEADKQKVRYALVEIPTNIPRLVHIPKRSGEVQKVIMHDDVIRMHLKEIFSIFVFSSIEAYTFKITRDAELDVDDDISKSFVEKMQDSIGHRKKGATVRFVYDQEMPEEMLGFLKDKQRLEAGENLIPGGRYHNFKDFMNFPDFGRRDFVFEPIQSTMHPALRDTNKSIIKTILERDVLITYPFQTFQHIIDILREAAIDPKVISIKINLYRVAPNSQIINALISAALNGKKVTAVIELKARFDEANNIRWSEGLKENGVNVQFGVPNMKVHSKMFVIKRKSGDKNQLIAHIGTGNFHERTALFYTDCALLTSHPRIAKEVDKIFRIFKNNMDRSVYRELMVSPFNTRRKLNSLLEYEIEQATNGEEAYIFLKMNNLVDAKLISKLYEASNAGVKIHCIIRGVCALVPGIPKQSENITVRSIVGRFLEHSRIMIFCNGGDEKYFISSADWMGRNLDRRIEVATPVFDPEIQKDLKFIVEACLKDNQKSRIIDAQQKNRRYGSKTAEPYNSQMEIYRYFRAK